MRHLKKSFFVLNLLLIGLYLSSCSKDKDEPDVQTYQIQKELLKGKWTLKKVLLLSVKTESSVSDEIIKGYISRVNKDIEAGTENNNAAFTHHLWFPDPEEQWEFLKKDYILSQGKDEFFITVSNKSLIVQDETLEDLIIFVEKDCKTNNVKLPETFKIVSAKIQYCYTK